MTIKLADRLRDFSPDGMGDTQADLAATRMMCKM
jgi:hypothetical protein